MLQKLDPKTTALVLRSSTTRSLTIERPKTPFSCALSRNRQRCPRLVPECAGVFVCSR
jgi:hypothetical protein